MLKLSVRDTSVGSGSMTRFPFYLPLDVEVFPAKSSSLWYAGVVWHIKLFCNSVCAPLSFGSIHAACGIISARSRTLPETGVAHAAATRCAAHHHRLLQQRDSTAKTFFWRFHGSMTMLLQPFVVLSLLWWSWSALIAVLLYRMVGDILSALLVVRLLLLSNLAAFSDST